MGFEGVELELEVAQIPEGDGLGWREGEGDGRNGESARIGRDGQRGG